MRCGNCKDDHDTVDEVKKCYVGDSTDGPQWPASDAQINYVLGLQAERNLPDWWPTRTEAVLRTMERDDVSADINQLKTFTKNAKSAEVVKPKVPAGRYALKFDDGWKFYEVTDGKGRWDGYKFIKRLIGAPGDYQKAMIPSRDRTTLFKRIEADPNAAMTAYGLHAKVCGKCHSPLSTVESLRRGIGPKCLAKLGW